MDHAQENEITIGHWAVRRAADAESAAAAALDLARGAARRAGLRLDLVDDVSQETVIRLLAADLSGVPKTVRLTAWLAGAIRNVVREWGRRTRREHDAMKQFGRVPGGTAEHRYPPTGLATSSWANCVKAALTERQFLALRLHSDGRRPTEAAAELGIRVDTYRELLTRGMRAAQRLTAVQAARPSSRETALLAAAEVAREAGSPTAAELLARSAAGESFTSIGTSLGITRRAAQQRARRALRRFLKVADSQSNRERAAGIRHEARDSESRQSVPRSMVKRSGHEA
jgi:DNA-directed RNA polymerase specialized sigma24 family protein